MPNCLKCGAYYPIKVFVDGKQRNFQRRKYCLACSPLNSHNTRKLEEGRDRNSQYKCKFCERDCGTRRKVCPACQTSLRRIKIKLKLVEYMGGKCERCGWSGSIAAFQFHHKSGINGNKVFEIGSSKSKSLESLKKESDKCELLCANCHRIHHATRWNSILSVLELN